MTVYTITGTVEFTKILIPPEGANDDYTEEIKAQFPQLVESVMHERFDQAVCKDIKVFKVDEDNIDDECEACKIDISETPAEG